MTVFHNFLEKRSVKVRQRIFGNISYDLWICIGEEDDDDMVKEKVIDFLNPFHVAINKKDFFEFQVTNDQSSVTQRLEICLPTTCKLLGISRCMGQAVKAALLCKEEASTNILLTVAEKSTLEVIFIVTCLTISLFLLCQQVPKPGIL